MKKFEKTTISEQDFDNISQKKPFLSTQNLFKLLPEILKVLPNLNFQNLFNPKINTPQEPQTNFSVKFQSTKDFVDNKKFALKTLEQHKKAVENLKKKKA